MKILKASGIAFEKAMGKIDTRLFTGPAGVEKVVSRIIRDIRRRGDTALLSYTRKLDKVSYTSKTMRVSGEEFAKAEKASDPRVLKALKKAATRIKKFHARQKESSWAVEENGATLGQIVRPLSSVGIYVPGGKAAYPSSVLMNAIPAKLAGVSRIVMVTPTPGGEINPHVLMAAIIAGVDEVWKIGGAQAVAALAFGTKTIQRVDKIVGPGNAYVAEAKRQLYGIVDIDMVAGPSEILVIADESADPAMAAADLLSQAEHDENAYPILVTTSRDTALDIDEELKRQTKLLPRAALIRKCLRRNCYGFIVKNLDEGFELANRIAPEHLELLIKNAEKKVNRIKNAGAIFAGPWTPEALGDYMAGPNHVLPTGGSARFFSPLGVYDFVKRTSLLSFTRKGFRALARDVAVFAHEERLSAHARAVEMRLDY